MIYHYDEHVIEDLFNKVIEKDIDDEEGNNRELNLEKKLEKNEFVDLFVKTKILDPSKANGKDYKVSVPKIMKENDILELLLKANEQQLQIVMHCLHAQKSNNAVRLVICGQAGTGKSFLIKLLFQTISDYYNEQISCLDIESAKVVLAAPSGKAAFLIGGATIHS